MCIAIEYFAAELYALNHCLWRRPLFPVVDLNLLVLWIYTPVCNESYCAFSFGFMRYTLFLNSLFSTTIVNETYRTREVFR